MSGVCYIVTLHIQQSAAEENTPGSTNQRTVLDILTSSSDALSLWLTPFLQYCFLRSVHTTVLLRKRIPIPNVSLGQLPFRNHHINVTDLTYTEKSGLPAQQMHLEM